MRLQLEEPTLDCLDCKRSYSINSPEVQFGLFKEGKLMRCDRCFKAMKHRFWLERIEQE
jgi:hypothetical protein